MKRIVIGTAGHIDHGKTALVKALTGIDCDRLKVEKERGITTELGFAHYRFGDEFYAGIVDVPGHEKFVRHMVAGAWGIDMVLLVVAADEGVMPQTREHVDICELLGLKRGIVVITKKDLVDEDMLELVREDVSDFLKGRFLEGMPVIAVSAQTGENLETLREMIISVAREVRERSREGIFRLPVDRVFTLRGFGTVVTGTCISGSVRTGDEIEVYPLGRRARVRNIQIYHEDAREASAGERTALNLQGIDHNEIPRGAILGKPGTLVMTQRIDASFRFLDLPLKPIKTDSILRFHIATTQAESRLVVLTGDLAEPGKEYFVQWVFSRPIAVLPGDRYIIRGSYAYHTIGGGNVLDVSPAHHKRKSPELGNIYQVLGGNDDLLKARYHVEKAGAGGTHLQQLAIRLGKDTRAAEDLVSALLQEQVVEVVGRSVILREKYERFKKDIVGIVTDYANKNPQKAGIQKEELRSKLPRVDISIFQSALENIAGAGTVDLEKDRVMLRKKAGEADLGLAALESEIMRVLWESGLMPPTLQDLSEKLKAKEGYLKDILEKLVFQGRLVKVKGDLYYPRETMEEIKKTAQEYLRQKKEMTPTEFKSSVNLSRKYLIPILEYLDTIKLTIRVGDKRVLRNRDEG